MIAVKAVVGNEGVMAADTGDAPPTYEIKFAKQSGAEAIESSRCAGCNGPRI